MKLRCIKNSIRIRLRKSDVLKLTENLILEEKIHFPNHIHFTYALKLTDHQINASCKDHEILIELNEEDVNQWAKSSEVSLQFKLPAGNNQSLSILIEKDFPCKHTSDDFEDTYYELQPEAFRMHRKT